MTCIICFILFFFTKSRKRDWKVNSIEKLKLLFSIKIKYTCFCWPEVGTIHQLLKVFALIANSFFSPYFEISTLTKKRIKINLTSNSVRILLYMWLYLNTIKYFYTFTVRKCNFLLFHVRFKRGTVQKCVKSIMNEISIILFLETVIFSILVSLRKRLAHFLRLNQWRKFQNKTIFKEEKRRCLPNYWSD